MLAVVAVYGTVYGAFWGIGHFFGHGVQHTVMWLVIVTVVSYYSADYASVKRRLKAAENKLQSIPLT